MKKDVWREAVAGCADPKRAEKQLELLRQVGATSELNSASPEGAAVLTALLSGSQALSETLVAHPDWLPMLLDVESLKVPRGARGLQRSVGNMVAGALRKKDYAAALAQVRTFKQQEIMRVAARDLARLGSFTEITMELSDLADACLGHVYRICWQQLVERFGQPYHQDPSGFWRPTAFCIIGLGKLGGQELNYSSDVDVIFVYEDEGSVFRQKPTGTETSGRGINNHQFFRHLAEAFVGEVGRLTPEGMLYRIDLRLRPEGSAGPLARSLESYENYYWEYGQPWERLMLTKARLIAGDAGLANDFMEMIQPFRYPRSFTPQALEEVVSMKVRLETEVVRAGELDRNVKLGRGGIREIEFLVQSQQVLRAGSQPFLAHHQTLGALSKLAQYGVLSEDQAHALSEAYVFLREVEHRLQMENNLQTHTIPSERRARERLARLMGFETLKDFEAALDRHRRLVRSSYEQFLKIEGEETASALPEFDREDAEWKKLFTNCSFRDAEKALRLARAFVHGPGFGHVHPRTEKNARQMLVRLLDLCPRRDRLNPDHGKRFPDGEPGAKSLSDPDRVLARLDTFIAAYGSRALLFETWAANPMLFELLVLLIDRSEFLAETAIRTPDLLDSLEESGQLLRCKTADQTLRELQHGRSDPDQRLWLRRYHQTEIMRIGLRDILGLAEEEQCLSELSALAEACLEYALEVVWETYGGGPLPLAVVGLGKLGGSEIDYGSDLDVMLVAEDRARDLAKLQRVAAAFIEMVSGQTELGSTFKMDVRLRPDGEKGLLVNPLRACEEYYRNRAQLWEIQALSRCRFVAGNRDLGDRFERAVTAMCDFSKPTGAAVAARTPNWKQEIARMRFRIEKERTPHGKDHLAIKTGTGGLVDAEFVAQALALEHGWHEPNTLRALELARNEGALERADADLLIDNFRKLRRVACILRRWSYEGETELPDDPAPMYRVAVRCGFTRAEDLIEAVARYRRNIRAVYNKVFGL